MALIEAADIYRRVYKEIVNEVTRFEGEDDDENTAVTEGIESAILEAQSYLSRFDIPALFDDPETPDKFLKDLCIDLAVFRILGVRGAGIDYEQAKSMYDAAKRTLREIQAGDCMPKGWTYKDTTSEDVPNGNSIEWTSNAKINFHF